MSINDKELGIETDAIVWAIRSSKTGVVERSRADAQLSALVKLIRSLREQLADEN